MAEFQIPEFLENQSVDDIHERMAEHLPEDIDISEGSHLWNLTRPYAYEEAFWAEFMLPEIIKMIFPMFCEDYPEIMDWHAECTSLTRKAAGFATGSLEITGEEGTEIPEGTAFSTLSINGEPSVEFVTTETVTIGSAGVVLVHIQASVAGTSGNVPAGTIIGKANKIDGITCTNPEATTGGTEEESTEALQARIVERDSSMEEASNGTELYYKGKILTVDGTGGVVVISPEDDTTPIKFVLTDANGDPANEDLCQKVWDFLMKPDNPSERLVLINDQIEIIPPETVNIGVSATIELEADGTIDQAKKAFTEALKAYFIEAAEDGEIRYSKVWGVLSDVEVVADHKNMLINGATDNIIIENTQIAQLLEENITFTIGTV